LYESQQGVPWPPSRLFLRCMG